jgi:hypothetical protein
MAVKAKVERNIQTPPRIAGDNARQRDAAERGFACLPLTRPACGRCLAAREITRRADDHQRAEDGPAIGNLGEQKEPGDCGERQAEEIERRNDGRVHDTERPGHRERRQSAAHREQQQIRRVLDPRGAPPHDRRNRGQHHHDQV